MPIGYAGAPMHAVVDVHYSEGTAVAGCVGFVEWTDSSPAETTVASLAVPGPYVPGRFYERELPCVLDVLERAGREYETIVVDGYVHLQPPTRLGLGGHLLEALPYRAAVIGVAKNPLAGADRFVPVLRGRSRKPLYVSAAGVPLDVAAERVRRMHGAHRLPTLIRAADRLCRAARP